MAPESNSSLGRAKDETDLAEKARLRRLVGLGQDAPIHDHTKGLDLVEYRANIGFDPAAQP